MSKFWLLAERFLRGFVDGNSSERVNALLQQFEGLKEDFDRSVRVRLLSSVLTSGKSAILDPFDIKVFTSL